MMGAYQFLFSNLYTSHPDDFNYTKGSLGNSIIWQVNDTANEYIGMLGGYGELYRDGILYSNKTWSGPTSLVYNIDGATPGVHKFDLVVKSILWFDGMTLLTTTIDVVYVTVIDTKPMITSPSDLTYEVGITGNSIGWTVTDSNIGTTGYTIYQNSTQIEMGTWTSGTNITIAIDGLSAGIYNYTIVVSDGNGEFATDIVLVTINNITDTSSDTTPDTNLSLPGYSIFIVGINMIFAIVFIMKKRR
jgi:hypothetical protein